MALENKHDDTEQARDFIKHIDGADGALLASHRSIRA